jgi:hypothetical protein
MQTVKAKIVNQYTSKSSTIWQTVITLGICEIILIVLCFLFSLSRLLKVTNGFSELLSIFIQMDNTDIRKIMKYTDYVHILFNHLRFKYEKMGETTCLSGSSTSNHQEFEKMSTEQGKP